MINIGKHSKETTMDIEKLFTSVLSIFGVSIEEVRSESRIRDVADSRKALVYFMKRHFKMGANNISKQINKSHCTISYMFEKAEVLIKHDMEFSTKINQVGAANGLDNQSCPCCGRPFKKESSYQHSALEINKH